MGQPAAAARAAAPAAGGAIAKVNSPPAAAESPPPDCAVAGHTLRSLAAAVLAGAAIAGDRSPACLQVAVEVQTLHRRR